MIMNIRELISNKCIKDNYEDIKLSHPGVYLTEKDSGLRFYLRIDIMSPNRDLLDGLVFLIHDTDSRVLGRFANSTVEQISEYISQQSYKFLRFYDSTKSLTEIIREVLHDGKGS